MSRSAFSKLLLTPVDHEFDWGAYRFKRSLSDDEIAAALELRQKVYVEEQFIQAPAPNEPLFSDEFDQISEHLAVFDRFGALVATTRLVLPTEAGFPTEKLFNVTRPPFDLASMGEFSRLAIAPSERGGSREPMIGLLKLVYEVMAERRIANVYAFMPRPLVDSYATLGCVSERLEEGPPSAENLARRARMSGYFRQNDIWPVLFRLETMIPAITAP